MISIDPASDFSIFNLPWGVFSASDGIRKIGVAIGDFVLDCSQLPSDGFSDEVRSALASDSLNNFMGMGRPIWSVTRSTIQGLLKGDSEDAFNLNPAEGLVLVPRAEVKMHMPCKIGDYTDFYSSIHHATNVGIMFRGKENALMPNWTHIPVGYHGRASSVVVSGTPLHRPKGQQRPNPEEPPVFGPCRLMDFELEMAFLVGTGCQLGESIDVNKAQDHIFGMVLMNDWSARDIQKWEYVPLGPFLGKNFGTTISPWVVTMDALEQFTVPNMEMRNPILDYLKHDDEYNFDIKLQVGIKGENMEDYKHVTDSNFKYMYWTVKQQLAHHTINGCNASTGDLYGSGTISGPSEGEYGSMLELSWKGTREIKLDENEIRKFLKNGDSVKITGHCEKDGKRIGFGECEGTILAPK